jgi:GNAT superfamily N-acetyltransferase
VTDACILTAEGELAASGHAAESHGVFIYDRIVVEPEHRRRGLGKALMAALSGRRQSLTAKPVLVATEAGRALYSTLGWALHAPYTTAFIPQD